MKSEKRTEALTITVTWWSCANPVHRHTTQKIAEVCLARSKRRPGGYGAGIKAVKEAYERGLKLKLSARSKRAVCDVLNIEKFDGLTDDLKAELANLSFAEIFKFPGVGRRSLAEIDGWLIGQGFRLNNSR